MASIGSLRTGRGVIGGPDAEAKEDRHQYLDEKAFFIQFVLGDLMEHERQAAG
jgi:hypothetical protein